MKSWLRHFILGIVVGIFSILLFRVLYSSAPGYDNDSNLLVTLFLVLAYGVVTAILGEVLLALDRKNTKS